MQFTEMQQTKYETLKESYQQGNGLRFSGKDSNIRSPLLNYSFEEIRTIPYLQESQSGYYLTTEELQKLWSDGIIEPKKLPNFSDNLAKKLYEDVNSFIEYYERIKSAELSRLGNFFVISALQLLEENIDAFLQPSISIYNTTKLYLTTQPFRVSSGEGLYHLHSDYTYVTESDLSMRMLNFHIALSKVTDNSSPLMIFPGTHRELVTQESAYKYIFNNKMLGNEEELLLKALACSYEYFGTVPDDYLNIREQTPYKYDYAPCSKPFIYKYYLDRFASEPDINSVYTVNDIGEYTLFIPSLLHYSLTPNMEVLPRVSIVIRVLDHSPTIMFNTLINLFNQAFTEFLGKDFKLKNDDISTILFDKPHLEGNTLVLTNIAVSDDYCELPCMTLSRLKSFYCNAEILPESSCIGDTHQIHDEL